MLDEEQVPAKVHLKLSGVVRRDDVNLRVRNAIYRTVFDARWARQRVWANWEYLRRVKLSGVVRRDDVNLRVRNAIYRTVFDARWARQRVWANWEYLRRAVAR